MTIHERERADNADVDRASADVDRASVRASGAARCISKATQMQRIRMRNERVRNERVRTERVVPRTLQATGITGSLAILIACQATAGIAPDRLPPTVCGLHCLPDCLPDCLQSASASASTSAASREKLL